MKVPAESYVDLSEVSMVEIKGWPLITVIEMGGETHIYRIDDPRGYWNDIRDPFYSSSTIEDLKRYCDGHGVPISEEEFLKAKIFPAFIKTKIEGSYKEFRANFG